MFRIHLLAQQNELSEEKINSLNESFKNSYSKSDTKSTAKNYEELSSIFYNKEELDKAVKYLKKAQSIYIELNLKNDIARVSRRIAQIQEKQQKINEAINNYELAQNESDDKEEKQINSNDANRLKNSTNQGIQSSYSSSNINLFKKKGKKQELANAYQQQAENSLQQNNPELAIQNYNNALENTDNNSTEQVKIKNELASVYLNNNQPEKAKEIKNEIISNSIQTNNVSTEIQQKQSLASILLKEQNEREAIKLLQESYEKAVVSSNTIEAKKSVELLIKHYQGKGDYQKSIQLYDLFMKELEQLIKSDSSLRDTQLLESTVEKIAQLEKEKKLQDQLIENKNILIEKQNTFNYYLIGGIILIILFLIIIARAFFLTKSKNKKIALQSLRREMNPHFIFNSLNSVNQFIAENNELEANKYLSSYSNLMRNVMENSNNDFITLNKEIDLIKKYLDLEHLRFQEKFNYSIQVDEKLDTESTLIPNMLIQPQLENAIWHGLRYKNEKGLLNIKFSVKDKIIHVVIDDDGIGLTKSKELKTTNQKSYESRGLNNTKERVNLLNELYKKKIILNIQEKIGTQGTIVEIKFPLINKI